MGLFLLKLLWWALPGMIALLMLTILIRLWWNEYKGFRNWFKHGGQRRILSIGITSIIITLCCVCALAYKADTRLSITPHIDAANAKIAHNQSQDALVDKLETSINNAGNIYNEVTINGQYKEKTRNNKTITQNWLDKRLKLAKRIENPEKKKKITKNLQTIGKVFYLKY